MDHVNVIIHKGETLAIVGESGCGKTTLARLLCLLIKPDEGEVLFYGEPVNQGSPKSLLPFRRKVQILFQDPLTSLDPLFDVDRIITEPLRVQNIGTPNEAKTKVLRSLQQVGLPEMILRRKPYELSGGQRQRVALARALVLDPDLVICDEPTTALDVSIQVQVMELLVAIQRASETSFIFITHNLALVPHIAHRIAVMFMGRIVEQGPIPQVLNNPHHPYTWILRESARLPSKDHRLNSPIQEEPMQDILPAQGCRFRFRCPWAFPECHSQEPPLRNVAPSHSVACYLDSLEPKNLPISPHPSSCETTI